MMKNIRRDLDYTGIGDESAKRKIFSISTLLKLVEETQCKTFDEIDLEGERIERLIYRR